jgi:hypothetical protein
MNLKTVAAKTETTDAPRPYSGFNGQYINGPFSLYYSLPPHRVADFDLGVNSSSILCKWATAFSMS